MYILGLSTGVIHDSSACLIKDGKLIAAAEEERFTRIKHDVGYPKNSIDYCLKQAGIELKDIDYAAIHFSPWKQFFLSAYHYLEGLKKKPVRSIYYIIKEFSLFTN